MTEQSWCMKCGRKMRYNIPRLGSDGGFVHDDTGYFSCDAESLEIFKAAVEAEVQRRVAEMNKKPVGYLDNILLTDHGVSRCYDSIEEEEGCTTPVYAAPPQTQLQAAIDRAREEAAKVCDKIANENPKFTRGDWIDCAKHLAEEIRARIGKPLGDSHDNG